MRLPLFPAYWGNFVEQSQMYFKLMTRLSRLASKEWKTVDFCRYQIDLTDRRKRLVIPTEKLIAAYTKYSDHLVDFQIVFGSQMDKPNRSRRVHKPEPRLHFDLLDYMEERPRIAESVRAKINLRNPIPIAPVKERK
jgi:hypothetical protein